MSGSILFFGEKITNMDKIGVLFIIIGILLVMYEGAHPTSVSK
jgi:drug/metabolite transporter (DMT)-like permease